MKKIIVLAHDKFEDMELLYPVFRLREEGYTVDIAGEKENAVYTGKFGYPVTANKSFNDIDTESYDGLIIPGGYAPDKLRRYDSVLKIVKYFDGARKPIGQICHAASVAISAKILKGKKVTSFIAIKDDCVNAGADWLNEKIVVDKNLVSAQVPDDLPVFMKKFIELLKA